MNPADNDPRHLPADAQDGALVLTFLVTLSLVLAGYLLIHSFHIRPAQMTEMGIYLLCLIAGSVSLVWYLGKRRRRIDVAWPHPPIWIPTLEDRAHLRKAFAQDSIVLGYDAHARPWFWPDEARVMQGLLIGQNGSGKTTLLRNIISQDVRRVLGPSGDCHRMPIIIVDGKGDQEFMNDLLVEVASAGRLDQLRILNPSRPEVSCRYNPCYSPDGAYLDHASLIFESFGLDDDFFKGHQASYFNDLSRVLWHTGVKYSIRDILIMALDEQVMKEQIQKARERIEQSTLSWQERDNFEMSVHLLRRSLQDRERVAKIQGLLNQLMTFIHDDLSVVTGSYEDLLTLDDVIEEELILVVSLNTNRNPRAVTALGKMVLQNLQLMVGKRYEDLRERRRENRPMVSVILDEFAPFSYPNFAQILQTARGTHTAFLFSLQTVSQLLTVGRGFQQNVLSAPNTLMVMHTTDEETTRYFCQASARITGQRKTMKVERKGLIDERLEEKDEGSLTEIEKTRIHEFHIKNLPVGQMQILETDRVLGTIHSHLHIRRPPHFRLAGFEPTLYPSLITPRSVSKGADLHFRDEQLLRRHARGGRPRSR